MYIYVPCLMKISFKTKLNVCQFYIGVCCFNRNFIFMYRYFFSVSKKKGGGGRRKKEEIHTGVNK